MSSADLDSSNATSTLIVKRLLAHSESMLLGDREIPESPIAHSETAQELPENVEDSKVTVMRIKVIQSFSVDNLASSSQSISSDTEPTDLSPAPRQ